jgi:hypothetical protein
MSGELADMLAVDSQLCGMFTASPGIITAFDGTLATVKISIRMKVVRDGVVSYLDPPPITNVPVVLPSSMGAGVFLTIPIKSGDPCLLVFSQRGIDNVVEVGGVQNPPDTDFSVLSRIRHHDMADAICIPGLAVKPSAPTAWAVDGIELRNANSTVSLKVTPSGIESRGFWMHNGGFAVMGGNIHVGKANGGGGSITTDGGVT